MSCVIGVKIPLKEKNENHINLYFTGNCDSAADSTHKRGEYHF